MEIAILGILSSIATELITLLNKKLTGTVFQGNAALLLSIVFAFLAGLYRVMTSGMVMVNFGDIIAVFVQAFGYSQLYFQTIATWFGLQVKQPQDPTTNPLAQ